MKSINSSKILTIPAEGSIAITLRNDLMFHHVMQTSNSALRALICATKGLKSSEIKDVAVKNPIEIDESVSNEIILDVLVTLNNDENIDIELQLYYDKDWIRRSLLYLCRTYDSSMTISDENERKYEKLKATTLIAIIDKNVCFNSDEFYSHYCMINTKTHAKYSSLLNINVLNLSQIELATNEDINSGLTGWAQLFNARNWEDVNTIVSDFPFLKEVAIIMYEANADIKSRSLMRAHEEYLTRVYNAEYRMQKVEEKAAKDVQEAREKAEKDVQEAREKAEKDIQEVREKAEKDIQEAREESKQALQEANSKIAELEAKLKAANIEY